MIEQKLLSRPTLMSRVPSAYTTVPYSKVSKNYVLFNTGNILHDLNNLGWAPSYAVQSMPRDVAMQGYQKHMLRLRKKDVNFKVGETIPEIIIINGHNGRVGFKFLSGLYEVRCGNGLVVLISGFDNIKLRHMGYTQQELEKLIISHTKKIDVAFDQIDNYKNMMLTLNQKMHFAQYVANELKLNKVVSELLNVRREVDKEDSLWRTFNVVQENIIKGGLVYSTPKRTNIRTREVKSIDRNVKSNMVLWGLLEQFYKTVHNKK